MSDEDITKFYETDVNIQQDHDPTSAIDDDDSIYVDHPITKDMIHEAAAKDTCIDVDVVHAKERLVEGD